MNSSLKRNLIISYAIIILLIIFLAIISTRGSYYTGNLISQVNEEVLPQTMEFIELEKNVMRIQQHLTTISASRAAFGLDEGFAEAADAYERIQVVLQQLIEEHSNEADMQKKLEQLGLQIDDFYELGRETANVYIKQ